MSKTFIYNNEKYTAYKKLTGEKSTFNSIISNIKSPEYRTELNSFVNWKGEVIDWSYEGFYTQAKSASFVRGR